MIIAATTATASPPIPVPPPGSIGPPFTSHGVATACWVDARYFRDLRNGVVDYFPALRAFLAQKK